MVAGETACESWRPRGQRHCGLQVDDADVGERDSAVFLIRQIHHDVGFLLQFTGNVTYNGHAMNEFIPQRTAAYISQHDLHLGEMTVRETLAFSARCQGVGTQHG